MKLVIQWLASMSAGFLLSTNTMRFFKVANEQEDAYIAAGMEASAVEKLDENEPYIMGSEQLNSALQYIFSSDGNDADYPQFMGYNSEANYALGSESLNRMLEEMQTPKDGGDNAKLPHLEPAIQL
ncbi:CG17648 [Drosophila busckii]|uniref:CG17648 n=1 Tax=Drosophila busckii TaxID=30019 RepID=A0A0M4ERJ8_DROBS|nr:uncharacterized protein LOC108605017 [Drosophila busckii]ALC39812.1 CG17648 [Drosophila busckii]